MRKIVIGIGDDFFCDDAIGLILLRKLQNNPEVLRIATLLEFGKKSSQIIDWIKANTLILIIDAVKMGLKPGEFKIFRFTEVKAKTNENTISFHQFGIAENLLLAESLGKDISSIYIFGIEPERLEIGNEISDVIKSNIEKYIAEIKNFLYNI